MRANTKKKHGIRKRFAIVIGVAAAGVMALGAQTGAQTQAPTPPGQAPPTCKGKPATIVGTDGGETLGGTSGPDVIVGLGGDDSVVNPDGGFPRRKSGNDVICGGDGRDSLDGGPGNDTLLGQAGSDLLIGKKGKNILLGQAGSDLLDGNLGNKDRCEGGKGHDFTVPWATTGVDGTVVESKSRTTCEVEKSIEKSGFIPPSLRH